MRPLAPLLTLLALHGAVGLAHAAAPVAPCPPIAAASGPALTAPTSPTERIAPKAGPVVDDRANADVTPQVAVRMEGGTPNATALKPGKSPGKPSGQVVDDAARCRATRPG